MRQASQDTKGPVHAVSPGSTPLASTLNPTRRVRMTPRKQRAAEGHDLDDPPHQQQRDPKGR